MIGSLWTGISGLSTHQAALDNESHNIANVNTIGYKSSRISFADQMYQDTIGKGSKVLDAEKIYSQGNMKSTGVAYDVALEGSGFFAVKDPNATGTSTEYYTRAGNFRMGENGTLQDSNLYDVIGWSIAPIDVDNDVISTNSNITKFTNDYVKIAANQIVQKDTSIETITAKLTDYTSSSISDDDSVMSGLGMKSMSTKISDVELLITDYQEKLKSYANDPSANSSPSIAQVSAVSLPAAGTSKLSTASDQLYIYIDGIKYSQSYIETSATSMGITAKNDQNGDGNVDATDSDILASRIATYKALADQISKVPGMSAYIADPSTSDTSNPTATTNEFKIYEGDVSTWASDDSGTTDGNDIDENPVIVIKSLIPGEEFVVGDVAEYIATDSSLVPGGKATVTASIQGFGLGAVESSREALMKVSTGYQRDVWSSNELPDLSTDDDNTLTFNITNPSDSTSPFTFTLLDDGSTQYDTTGDGAVDATLTNANLVDAIVNSINADTDMSELVKAHNYNGNLVVETISSNPGGSFVSSMSWNNGTTDSNLNKSTTLSINSGAGAEFIEMINKLDQTASKDSLQLRLDNLGISDSAFGDFSIDSTGLITMKQDGVEFAVGQTAIAMFNNERGLTSEGNNLMSKTNDSGSAVYNINNDKAAKVAGKTLELSTADLSESLVNLMVFQRAFEANSKSITTSDQILTTLIQLKK